MKKVLRTADSLLTESLTEIFSGHIKGQRFTQQQRDAVNAAWQAGMSFAEMGRIVSVHPDSLRKLVPHGNRTVLYDVTTPDLSVLRKKLDKDTKLSAQTIEQRRVIREEMQTLPTSLQMFVASTNEFRKVQAHTSFGVGAFCARIVYAMTTKHELPKVDDWFDFRQGWDVTQEVLVMEAARRDKISPTTALAAFYGGQPLTVDEDEDED